MLETETARESMREALREGLRAELKKEARERVGEALRAGLRTEIREGLRTELRREARARLGEAFEAARDRIQTTRDEGDGLIGRRIRRGYAERRLPVALAIFAVAALAASIVSGAVAARHDGVSLETDEEEEVDEE